MFTMRVRSLAFALGAAAALTASALRAEVVTLPAAASIQGGNPFFSDVRVFNTSYTSSLSVTATYRCFIAGAATTCPASAPTLQFDLAPRQSRAFDDMVANASGFNAHDTAGGVEFETSGADGQLVVTSRLYSTFPQNTVGMFIPGLKASRAFATTVLTSIRHDPLNGIVAGFRTNAGAFNPGDVDASASFVIFDATGNQLAPALVRTVPAHSGVQISGIFEAAGLPNVATENAAIVVTANVPILTYAAVLDNRTADPIFVQGAPDGSQGTTPTPTPTSSGPVLTATKTPPGPSPTRTMTPMGGPSPTRTPTRTPTIAGPTMTPTQPGAPTATPTPTQPGPTSTPTSPVSTPTPTITIPPTITRTPSLTPTGTPTTPPGAHIVTVAPGGAHTFQDSTSGTNTTTITVGTTIEWQWAFSGHSVTSDTNVWPSSGVLSTGSHFDVTFNNPGTFPYYCVIHGGPGGIGMHGTVIVNP